MHKLLRRQLARVFGRDDELPAGLEPLLEAVDAAYHQFDHDRVLLERSLDLTSDELLAANRELRAYAAELEQRVAERTAELETANRSLALEIAERIAAQRAVGESEQRYRSLFTGSKDAIYISTPGGRLIDINPAGLELFGYHSLDEILEVDVARQLYRSTAARRAFLAEVDRQGFVRDGELELVRRDGRPLTVLATTAAVRDEAGEVVAYRGILRDVTDQRRLEQGLLQAQKMEAVGRLAGGVAHDFNNLLTAILGFSELLALRQHDPEVRSAAEAISAAAQRGAELTNQLLAFGRRQVLRPAVLDLNQVLEGLQQLLRRVIPEHIEISLELDPRSDPVEIDRTQIEQAIVNLAFNARDAMPGGGRLVLRTSPLEVADGSRVIPGLAPGRYLRVSVHDTGMGIEESVREHIFEPFFTTKGASRGTGLGLATVYAAVTATGGAIDVASEVGVGTTFDLYLPAAADQCPARAVAPPQRAPAPGAERLLLVEDDPNVQRVVQQMLENRGYTVLVADDGEAGLDLARREGANLDLVVSDVVMPRMNGVELASRLRTELPHVRVLLISGYAKDQEQLDEGFLNGELGAFLQKPFKPDDLARTIRQLLDAPPLERGSVRAQGTTTQ